MHKLLDLPLGGSGAKMAARLEGQPKNLVNLLKTLKEEAGVLTAEEVGKAVSGEVGGGYGYGVDGGTLYKQFLELALSDTANKRRGGGFLNLWVRVHEEQVRCINLVNAFFGSDREYGWKPTGEEKWVHIDPLELAWAKNKGRLSFTKSHGLNIKFLTATDLEIIRRQAMDYAEERAE